MIVSKLIHLTQQITDFHRKSYCCYYWGLKKIPFWAQLYFEHDSVLLVAFCEVPIIFLCWQRGPGNVFRKVEKYIFGFCVVYYTVPWENLIPAVLAAQEIHVGPSSSQMFWLNLQCYYSKQFWNWNTRNWWKSYGLGLAKSFRFRVN